MSEEMVPLEHPAGNGNGEAQPAQETQESNNANNEPQTALDNTAQEPILNDGNTEQPIADNTEQPLSLSNGNPTPVESSVQTEAMSANDVSNGSQAIVESNNEAVSEEPDSRPSVLIIGGLGYIGRFLANYIHQNKLASTLRIVDKQLPQLASLAPEHQAACSVERCVQADASREHSHPRIFDLPAATDGTKKEFDYVFNCGGETRYSQEDEVYKLRSYELSLALGKEAAKRGVKVFVEVSTASVYNPNRSPQKETDKTSKPHTKQAKWKLAAEEALAKISDLNLVVLRLPNVYGPYGGRWLSTQLALARVYQSREPRETMKWLWSGDLRTNTLHVEDAVRALWKAAVWRSQNDRVPNVTADRIIFNVVDKGQTTQGTVAGILKQVFNIETGFYNALVNTFARLNLEHVVDDVNDDTLDDWADLQEAAGIKGNGGPLSPFMEKEILRDADLSVDGSRFETVVGFRPQHERMTKEEVEAVIESFRTMKWWP